MYPDTVFLGMDLYSICVAVGIIVALVLADRLGVRKGFSIGLQKMLVISFVGAVAVGFFGAIFFQAIYQWIDTGKFTMKAGMTFYGGLIFGVIGFLLFWFVVSKPFGVQDEAMKSFKHVSDMAGAIIPLAHGLGRLGCFFAGCCYGKETSAWYGVMMHGQKIVPVQLFEAAFLFALAAVMFVIFFKRNKEENKRIPVLPIYAICYGVWRFFIEYARGDERGETIVPFLSPSQLIAIVFILAGVGYFVFWYFKGKKEKKNGQDAGDERV